MPEKELYVVTGKGGVGKSSVAAAIGMASARTRRTLILEIDPRENVHQMLDAPPSGGEIVAVGQNLWLQNLRPRQVVDRIIQERVPIAAVVRRVLSSPVYQHFAEGAPGLKEMAVLGHALEIVKGRVRGAARIDRVVLDAPATGHGVSLLTAPQLVSDAIEKGPVAELTREVSDWIACPVATGIVVVTLAEEMPVSETLELMQTLERKMDRVPDLVVVNQLYPPLPADWSDARDSLGRLWQKRRELNEREMARLNGGWSGPIVELALEPLDRGPALVAELATELGGWLDGVAL